MIQSWARGPSSPAASAPRADTKLMSEPSGDHAGAVSPCSLKVSWRWPVPSPFTRQTCVRAVLFAGVLAGAVLPGADRVQHGAAVGRRLGLGDLPDAQQIGDGHDVAGRLRAGPGGPGEYDASRDETDGNGFRQAHAPV